MISKIVQAAVVAYCIHAITAANGPVIGCASVLIVFWYTWSMEVHH